MDSLDEARRQSRRGRRLILVDSKSSITYNTTMKIYEVIIDSNVLVTGLRSALGASYKLLSLVGKGRFGMNISVPLLFEYELALKRDARQSGLNERDIDDILNYLCQISRQHKISYLWRPHLRDPKDDFILELAIEAGCDFIITYNKRDFQRAESVRLGVLSPYEFLKKIGELP